MFNPFFPFKGQIWPHGLQHIVSKNWIKVTIPCTSIKAVINMHLYAGFWHNQSCICTYIENLISFIFICLLIHIFLHNILEFLRSYSLEVTKGLYRVFEDPDSSDLWKIKQVIHSNGQNRVNILVILLLLCFLYNFVFFFRSKEDSYFCKVIKAYMKLSKVDMKEMRIACPLGGKTVLGVKSLNISFC